MKMKREGKRCRMCIKPPDVPFLIPITTPLLKSQIMKLWRKLDKVRELDGIEIRYMSAEDAEAEAQTTVEARDALQKAKAKRKAAKV